MDSFEKKVQEISTSGNEEKDRELDRMKKECICPDCPSYNKCAGDAKELLYCFLGKSVSCITDELGCICPDCPVAADLDLVNLYYCTQGSEEEMRKRS